MRTTCREYVSCYAIDVETALFERLRETAKSHERDIIDVIDEALREWLERKG